MEIRKDNFYVSGLYYVKTDSCKSGMLLYPFPESAAYGNIDSIYIHNLTSNEVIVPEKIESSHLIFKIDFKEENELVLHIAYQQELKASRAEYILTTTISWQSSFETANYQLITPSNFRIDHFSILPQDTISYHHKTIYLWEKKNYLPEENFIFDFSIQEL